jgi:hypothetical protein
MKGAALSNNYLSDRTGPAALKTCLTELFLERVSRPSGEI